jgi:SAM-dependent methyltransferase
MGMREGLTIPCRSRPHIHDTSGSRRANRALDAANFFLADVRDGLGPYLAIYLLTEQSWDEARIGIVMSIATFAGIVAQTPAGALVDATRAKRAVMIAAATLVTAASLVLPWLPSFWPVAASQAIAHAAGVVFAPALAAVTLGIVGHAAFTRRIGRNERNTIQACLAFVDAEREYASVDHNGDGVLEYAQRFISTPGTQDGLYWPATDGKEASPLGVAFAQASAAGYQLPLAPSEAADKGSVLYGYKYQILLSQGPAAPDGAYDYVIAHGFLSWVPPPVQERLMEVCRKSLAPQGVALISYNTYPGWHMRGMIRQMMLHHVRNIMDPVERINAARDILGFLADAFGRIIGWGLDVLRSVDWGKLAHDAINLLTPNVPVAPS